MGKTDKAGEINMSNEGYEMKIVEYNNANDIIVEFQDKYKTKVHTQYVNFKKGVAKNPYHPSVYNVGYLGVGKYSRKTHFEIYKCWKSMLQRCYDPYDLNKHPTYIDCCVCKEWLNFQTFARWYEENIYNCNNEVMCLDKDILNKNNKIYSPKTCIFVPHRINILFIKSDKTRGEYPIGVSYYKNYNKLIVKCNILDENGKSNKKYLGYFPLDKPFQAFVVYKQFKEKYIKQVADEYKELISEKLYKAMIEYEVEIND